MNSMAYETYTKIRRNSFDTIQALIAQQELFIDTALELFEGVAAYADAQRSGSLVQVSERVRRAELTLEGGLFVAEEHKLPANRQNLVTALASFSVGSDYDVVRNTFGSHGRLLDSQIFRTNSLDTAALCDTWKSPVPKNKCSIVGTTIRGLPSSSPIVGLYPVSDIEGAYFNNLRPVEHGVKFPSTEAIVGYRICETIDMVAGFAGRRS